MFPSRVTRPENDGAEYPAPLDFSAGVARAPFACRYWARSTFGWTSFHAARPNAAHLALARLEAEGRLSGIITQVGALGRRDLERNPRDAACLSDTPDGWLVRRPASVFPRYAATSPSCGVCLYTFYGLDAACVRSGTVFKQFRSDGIAVRCEGLRRTLMLPKRNCSHLGGAGESARKWLYPTSFSGTVSRVLWKSYAHMSI